MPLKENFKNLWSCKTTSKTPAFWSVYGFVHWSLLYLHDLFTFDSSPLIFLLSSSSHLENSYSTLETCSYAFLKLFFFLPFFWGWLVIYPFLYLLLPPNRHQIFSPAKDHAMIRTWFEVAPQEFICLKQGSQCGWWTLGGEAYWAVLRSLGTLPSEGIKFLWDPGEFPWEDGYKRAILIPPWYLWISVPPRDLFCLHTLPPWCCLPPGPYQSQCYIIGTFVLQAVS